MRTLIEEPPNGATGSRSARPCHFLLLYHDTPGKAQAARLRTGLCTTYGAEMSFRFSWWVFSVLRNPNLMHFAIAEAAAADVIIFSLGLNRHLPPEILEFNERWAGHRQGTEGLLAFTIQGSPEGPNRITSPSALDRYFRETARRAQMHLLGLDQNLTSFATRRQPAEYSNRINHRNTHIAYDRAY